MIRFAAALLLSAVLHALIAAAIGYLDGLAVEWHGPELDLSRVELSFAETEAETAPVAPVPPPPEEPPQPPALPPPPPPADEPVATVPDFDAPPLPEPPPEALPPPEEPPPPPEETSPHPPEETSPSPDAAESPEPPSRQEDPPPAPSPDVPAAAPASAPRQGQIDAAPSPVRTIRPEYPRLSRQRREEGVVRLRLHVNAAGRVETVEVSRSSGYPRLDEAAAAAVRKAAFKPARRGDSAVDAEAEIDITFKLRDH